MHVVVSSIVRSWYLRWGSYIVSAAFGLGHSFRSAPSSSVQLGARGKSQAVAPGPRAHHGCDGVGHGNPHKANSNGGSNGGLLWSAKQVVNASITLWSGFSTTGIASPERRNRLGHLIRIPRRLPCLGLRRRSIKAGAHRPAPVWGPDNRLKRPPPSTRVRAVSREPSTVSLSRSLSGYQNASAAA